MKNGYGQDLGNVRYELETEVVEKLPMPTEPEYIQDTKGKYTTVPGEEKEVIKATEGYRVSLRRRKMIEEAFGWVKDIGTLRRLMARGLETIRAHALLNFAAYNLTRLGNLLAS